MPDGFDGVDGVGWGVGVEGVEGIDGVGVVDAPPLFANHNPGSLPGKPVPSSDGAGTDHPGEAPTVLAEDDELPKTGVVRFRNRIRNFLGIAIGFLPNMRRLPL